MEKGYEIQVQIDRLRVDKENNFDKIDSLRRQNGDIDDQIRDLTREYENLRN